jgi:hypothetical protein
VWQTWKCLPHWLSTDEFANTLILVGVAEKIFMTFLKHATFYAIIDSSKQTNQSTNMLKPVTNLTFDNLPVCHRFATEVSQWQTTKPTGELRQEWSLDTMTAYRNSGHLDGDTYKLIKGLYDTLGLASNETFLTLHTRNQVWTDSQVYAPVVQFTPKGEMAIYIGDKPIILEVSHQSNEDDEPNIVIKAPMYVGGALAKRGVSIKTNPKKFKDDNNRELQVDRLVLLLPVTADRLSFVEIPFHPNKESRKSSNLSKAYFTRDFKTFWDTAQKELSVKSAGGEGGAMMDLNRLFRGRWDKVQSTIESLQGWPITFSEWKLITNVPHPAYALRVDLTETVETFGDVRVEIWGKNNKGQRLSAKLSEVKWIAINASNSMTYVLDGMESQPGQLTILWPNTTNSDFIPVARINPMCHYVAEDQQELFGAVAVPKALAPSTSKTVDVSVVQVSVEDFM